MALIRRTFEKTSVRRSRKRQLNLLSAQYSILRKIKSNKQNQTNKRKAANCQIQLHWVKLGSLQCVILSMANWCLYSIEHYEKVIWAVIRRQKFRKSQVLQSVIVNINSTICILLEKSWYWEAERPLKSGFG